MGVPKMPGAMVMLRMPNLDKSRAMGKVMQLLFALISPPAAVGLQASITHNLMSAGIAANSASSSADLLTDLKSGYLLGANPRMQFLAQFVQPSPRRRELALGLQAPVRHGQDRVAQGLVQRRTRLAGPAVVGGFAFQVQVHIVELTADEDPELEAADLAQQANGCDVARLGKGIFQRQAFRIASARILGAVAALRDLGIVDPVTRFPPVAQGGEIDEQLERRSRLPPRLCRAERNCCAGGW